MWRVEHDTERRVCLGRCWTCSNNNQPAIAALPYRHGCMPTQAGHASDKHLSCRRLLFSQWQCAVAADLLKPNCPAAQTPTPAGKQLAKRFCWLPTCAMRIRVAVLLSALSGLFSGVRDSANSSVNVTSWSSSRLRARSGWPARTSIRTALP